PTELLDTAITFFERDHAVDPRHHREERRHRWPGGHDDRGLAQVLPHIGNRRQRHHGVAQPVGGEDHQPLHSRFPPVRLTPDTTTAGGGTVSASMTPARPAPLPANPLLSVVMPVYNERTTVEEIIRRVLAVPLRIELIVVDDGSKDGSGEILDRLE